MHLQRTCRVSCTTTHFREFLLVNIWTWHYCTLQIIGLSLNYFIVQVAGQKADFIWILHQKLTRIYFTYTWIFRCGPGGTETKCISCLTQGGGEKNCANSHKKESAFLWLLVQFFSPPSFLWLLAQFFFTAPFWDLQRRLLEANGIVFSCYLSCLEKVFYICHQRLRRPWSDSAGTTFPESCHEPHTHTHTRWCEVRPFFFFFFF